MRIVAGLALQTCLAVEARHPLIGGGIVTGRAELGICLDRHGVKWVVFVQRPVASLASDALILIGVDGRVVAGGVAAQAFKLVADLVPILLKYGGGESMRMAS